MAFPLPKEEQEVLQAKGGTPEIHKVFVVLNPVAGLTDANNARSTKVNPITSVANVVRVNKPRRAPRIPANTR